MNKLKEQLHWVVIVLGILTVAPMAYYYAYALPRYNQEKLSLEKQKYQDEQDKEASEQRAKEDRQLSLDTCLLAAQAEYTYLWSNECSAWKVQVDTAWKNCRSTKYSWEDDQENKTRCTTSTPNYDKDSDGVCLLPKTRSESVEQAVEKKKEECYKKYPLQ